MNSGGMWGLRFCALTFLFVGLRIIDSFGQYDLQFQGPEKIDWCESVTYNFRIDRFSAAPVEDLVLNISFDHDVEYLSNSLALLVSQEDPRKIVLDLNEFEQCGYLSGSIEVFPLCEKSAVILGTSATLLNNTEILNSQCTRALIGAATLRLEFGPYTYDGVSNQVTNAITVTNVNTSTIENFDIELVYSEDFAQLSESSSGNISSRNLISFSPDDLPNGNLVPLESLEVMVTHDLLACEIKFLRYKVILDCERTNCRNIQTFVDENQVDKIIPKIKSPQAFNYGICDPVFNQIVIKHEDLEYKGVLEDAYGLSFTISLVNRDLNYLECITPTFRINNTVLEAIWSELPNRDGIKYSISLEDITTNIDGMGGLEDLNGDGFFNDFTRGDSIVVDIGIYYEEECDIIINPIRTQLQVFVLDLCNESIASPISSSSIVGGHDITAVPWRDLPKDVEGDRYYRIGDTVTWELNYRYSQNVDPLCLYTDMVLNITIPPSLVWIAEDIVFEGREDSLKWQVTQRDSLLTIPFDGRNSGFFKTRFIAKCPEEPIKNLDPDIPIEEQCIEWNTYNLLATIDNQCGDLCDLFIKTSPTFSTTTRTLCEEEEVYKNILSVDTFIINRMNGGWMDSAQTIRWDPEIYKNSPNQGYFYDHDTMRIQIPFVFSRANFLESIRLTIGNYLSNQEVDLFVFQSGLYAYDRVTRTLKEQCDLAQYTSDESRDITLTLDRTAIDNLCFEETDSMVWELLITPDVQRTERQESNEFISEGIRFFAEEKSANCFERVAYFQNSYFISEVFIPKLFDIQAIDFALGQVNLFSLALGNRNIVFEENMDFEYRNESQINNIRLEVPEDYELIREELYIISVRPVIDSFLNEDTYIPYVIYKTDTLLRIPTNSINMVGGNIEYDFHIDSSIYRSISFQENIFLGGYIKSICPTVAPQLVLEGNISYNDHYTGSLDRIELPFDIRSNLRFNPNLTSFADDFKIAGSEGKVVWFLKDVETTFDFLASGERVSIRYLEFNANGTRLDSLTRFVRVFPDTLLEFAVSHEKITETLFRITDTFYTDFSYNPANLSLNIYTSNSPCGFDTISIRYGQEVLFDENLCPEAIFEDELIIYTPVGLPQTRWIRYPEYIDLCDTSWFRWELNNIGEGGLTDVQLRISSLEVESPRLTITIDSLTIAVDNDAIRFENGAYEVALSDIGIDTLFGLIDADRKNIQMDWYWTPDCNSPNLYDVDIEVQAQTYCEEVIQSRGIPLSDIPLRILQDTAYNITLNAVSGPVCGDTVMMRVEVGGVSAQQLINDSLLVYLPREYAYYTGSALANDRQIGNPTINYEGTFQILSWVNTVRFGSDQPFILEFLLDGACSDICGRGEGRAILMSRVQASCNDLSCERYTSRAATPWELHFWRPKMELDITNFQVLSMQNAMMRAVITWDFSQIRNHIYDGQIQAQYYGDSDGNNLINIDEDIFATRSIYLDSSQQLSVTDTIEVVISDACELAIYIELERDCACFTAAEPIGMLESVTTRQEVSVCASDTYEIEMAEVEECSRSWNTHPRLDLSDPGQPIYNPSLTPEFVGSDTIVGLFDCDDCDFIDSIFIEVYDLHTNLVLDAPACNEIGATVSVMIDHPSPETLSYSWNIEDAGNSQTIDNVPLGLVEVMVSDNQGCSATAQLLVEPFDLEYNVTIGGDLCDSLAGQTVDIELKATDESAKVLWADGVEGSIRERLFSGSYPFQITSSNGCFVLDTLVISSSDLSSINYKDTHTIELGKELSIMPIEEPDDSSLSFSWEPAELVSCASCHTVLITPMGQVELSVTIMDSLGCRKIETIVIAVERTQNLYLPNVITHHGNASNTILYPAEHPSVARILTFRVFDRWGNSVMDKENLDPRDNSEGWRGSFGNQKASPGVYIYDITVLLIDGTEQRITSSVTLLP